MDIDYNTTVNAHDFVPLTFLDRFWPRGRCRACYASRKYHPIPIWVPARPFGDKRRLDHESETVMAIRSALNLSKSCSEHIAQRKVSVTAGRSEK